MFQADHDQACEGQPAGDKVTLLLSPCGWPRLTVLNPKRKDRADLGHSQCLGPATGTPGDVQAVDAPLETSFAVGAVTVPSSFKEVP